MSTVRRRALVAVVIGFPVGWMFIDIGWRLVAAVLLTIGGRGVYGVGCGGKGLSGLFAQFNGCDTLNYRIEFAIVELIIGVALAVVITMALSRWVTAPLRQMTDAVEQLGPANLGLRLRQQGPAREETRRLADAVDGMLDRVSEGYEAQRRFASNASHELRTPLATQRALIEISLTSDLTPDQLELLARQLLSTNERNERLIDGLLTLAETDRGLVSTTRLALDRTATEVVATLRELATERGLTVAVSTAPAAVVGEQALLDRLVTNLVQNAIKYNQPGGTVGVSVAADGTLAVTNTGPAVPPDQVGGLFEPFRRLSGERLDHGGGAGLGLTIARSIVAAHDGTIAARANPGGGLTVTVTLPGSPGGRPPAPAAPTGRGR